MPDEEAEVLIVDDETDLCWALAHVLKRSGIDSVWANAGHEALALARAHCFRLAFVDAKLPDLDGIELARRLREANPGVCVVLISGYFYRDDIEVHRAMAAGVINGFISKPFLHDEVRSIATQALA
jgi:DNA-binding NtrC family response regulator